MSINDRQKAQSREKVHFSLFYRDPSRFNFIKFVHLWSKFSFPGTENGKNLVNNRNFRKFRSRNF